LRNLAQVDHECRAGLASELPVHHSPSTETRASGRE
jgi:hypothetical protein